MAPRRREQALWLSVSVLAIALALAWFTRPVVDPLRAAGKSVRFEFAVPDLVWSANQNAMALAPQGDAIVYVSPLRPGSPAGLWVRDLDDVESRPISGTEGATNPFWSPNGDHIGYAQENAIKIVPRAGGPPRVLTKSGPFFGPPTWSSNDTILFSRSPAGSVGRLFRVPAKGGEPEEVTGLITEDSLGHVFPHWLPDGTGFFTLALSSTADRRSELYLGSLAGADASRIADVYSRVEYAAGYLYYWDQARLVTRRFDPARARFTDDPEVLGEMTGTYFARTGMAAFTVAQSGGVVAFGRKTRRVELKWFDRSGRGVGVLGEPGLYSGFRISPAGDRVAVEIKDERTGTDDIWIFDVERGVPTRLVGGVGDYSDPTWSSDGDRIAYSSDAAGPPAIFIRPADGSGEPTQVDFEDAPRLAYIKDWSSDGRSIVYQSWTQDSDIHLTSLVGRETSRLFAGGPGDQVDARFSPDGRWVAFGSSEMGSMEIFIAPFVDGSALRRVSTAGGELPAWSRDGSELYYASTNSLYVVSFASQTGTIGPPRRLFSIDERLDIVGLDLSPNGERFLVAVGDQSQDHSSITVVVGWSAEVD